ncbi:uncharacterized protein LOC132730542 [Ruditapes philippinarum]|uniref:uncharacterized protein LOC132730542 n=1 Tax=Ruditapes philippinarum TaxID=129788 RepID=UPI00295BE270|nr:uncharacterized protein LOC132730542 [Ruditapes philippinarum]
MCIGCEHQKHNTDMLLTVLFLTSLIQVVAPGHTMMCRQCDQVHHPTECMTHAPCQAFCVTDVHHTHGQYVFSYSCNVIAVCDDWNHHHHKPDHHGHHEEHVCKECCHGNLCDKHSCSKFIPNITTTTATTAHVSMSTQTTTTTERTTTAGATATSSHSLMKTTTPQQHCVDSADAGFTCDDMKYFGYCDPSAGAGYSLAQLRCPKHCGFCV